ncbi:response regulator transcription factor [Alcanivorax sp. 1008]|uniref:response regulator transcription factor n=1 Tax=Alcanivorax sp. 1008 TaxID=2816853 RepID=UPI001DE48B2B|nr:response regulator transcription factor [Alcanivorax sp. 1008]MCC1497393.1 response regulator transcription factor [Alcanivorax sp. 1008]
MRLLIVEDDRQLAERLQQQLSDEGLVIDLAHDGVDGQHLGEVEEYDLVVLDLGLPRRSGLDVLQAWRKAGRDMPVLILTARDGWRERVEGLRAGADDYLGKPFHGEELLARIHALLRRAAPQQALRLQVGAWQLDERRQCLVDGSRELALTATEFRLLRYMLRHPGELLSKTQLGEHLYEYASERESNVLEVYIRRLREKLGADFIETRRGQGYVMHAKGGG